LLRQRWLSLTVIKDHILIFSSNEEIRSTDSTTGLTKMTRNVWSVPFGALIETYSPGKNAWVPDL
jgi:hypothetical protein